MKIIPATIENGVVIPSEELPSGILTQFNGENYIIYEDGDILPEPLVNEPIEPTKEDMQRQLQTLLAQAQELMNKIGD
jgi:uncharacterized caspase-like protein